MYEIVNGRVNLKQLRDIQIEDLLGQWPVYTDMARTGEYLADRKVLTTGVGVHWVGDMQARRAL